MSPNRAAGGIVASLTIVPHHTADCMVKGTVSDSLTSADVAGMLVQRQREVGEPGAMDYRIDQQALGDIAGLAGKLPTLHAPIPPALAALEQRLSLPAAADALGVPAGCHTSLPPDLLNRLLGMALPRVALVAGLPTLGTLANLRFLVAVRLGFPIPNSLHLLANLMQTLDLRALSIIAQMPWGPLNGLAMLVNIGALLRARLGINPGQLDASLRIQEMLPLRIPAFGVPLPVLPPSPQLTLTLRYLLQLRTLFSLCEMMGVQLGGPGGIPHLSAQLRMLLAVRLPVLRVMPSLLPNLYLLARINAIWPLADIAMDVRPFRAHIAAILKLGVPPMPSCIGPMVPLDMANMPPPLPTAETVEKMLGTDLTELAQVNWKIPDVVPVAEAIPGLNALALLQEMGPVLVPKP
jgi:hypothetical protein